MPGTREQKTEYMVVERARYVDERDIRGFPTREATERHVDLHYFADAQGTLHVAVLLAFCDGTTYDLIQICPTAETAQVLIFIINRAANGADPQAVPFNSQSETHLFDAGQMLSFPSTIGSGVPLKSFPSIISLPIGNVVRGGALTDRGSQVANTNNLIMNASACPRGPGKYHQGKDVIVQTSHMSDCGYMSIILVTGILEEVIFIAADMAEALLPSPWIAGAGDKSPVGFGFDDHQAPGHFRNMIDLREALLVFQVNIRKVIQRGAA